MTITIRGESKNFKNLQSEGSNNSANGRSGLVLFYCSFLALRSEGIYTRGNTIFSKNIFHHPLDYVIDTISDDINEEQELFAG